MSQVEQSETEVSGEQENEQVNEEVKRLYVQACRYTAQERIPELEDDLKQVLDDDGFQEDLKH